jgi:hypothetical protein
MPTHSEDCAILQEGGPCTCGSEEEMDNILAEEEISESESVK